MGLSFRNKGVENGCVGNDQRSTKHYAIFLEKATQKIAKMSIRTFKGF